MNVKGLKKCCISHAVNGTDVLWNQSEKVENVGTSVKKMKALSVKMNTQQTMKMWRVTIIGKGEWCLTWCVLNCMKLIVKYFFLAGALLGRSTCVWANNGNHTSQ